ncbi:MAG: DUF885 domain-containing protein [Pirellula sp.]
MKHRDFRTLLPQVLNPAFIAFSVALYLSTSSSIYGRAPQDKASHRVLAAKCFDDYYQEYLILFPLEATAIGDNRYNHLMPARISPEFVAREKALYQRTLDQLSKLNPNQLDASDQLAAEILQFELQLRLDGLKLQAERIPATQFEGLHLSFAQMGSGTGSHPFKSVKDYDDWLQRIEAFGVWSRVAVDQFKRGSSERYVLPKALAEKMIPQMFDESIVGELEKSIFYQPIVNMPKAFSDADRKRLEQSFRDAIQKTLVPAYRSLGEYLRDEYLPRCRTTSGISDLPDGRQHYLYFTRYWTTTDMQPDEIFEIGQREVARIRSEMERVKGQMNYQGDLASFFVFLREDPQFLIFKTPNEVIDAFASIRGKIEPKLDSMFKNRPKTPFEIRRTEAFRESTASAEYMPGSADGTRAGIFYTPIPDASKFNVTSGMESLFLHEAIPGHHYQISLQQENERLPKFARILWYGAYGEGWALYCESLGKELGLYTDPRQTMGALNDEMHRAIRLVVDPGLHWRGWTREQAIQYMMDNESTSEAGAIAEIERYMSLPGQALSYKIGSLKIRELRTRYEQRLGPKFSLAAFHNEILKDGGMPLNILERRLDAWASRQRDGK